jgi:hypothetical protein
VICIKCGTELPDGSQFCLKCGQALGEPSASSASTAPSNPYGTFGAFVFASFSMITLLVSLFKGIVPIYLVESALWGALAWYWHKRNPTSQKTNLFVLLLAVVVAAGEGYSVGHKVGLDEVSPKGRDAFTDLGFYSPPPTTNPCDKGIPSGVRTEPLTVEEIAAFDLKGATVEQAAYGTNWFDVRFTNSPAATKCLTKVEFEIVLGPVGKEHTVHPTASGLSAGPGWGWTTGKGLAVSFPMPHGEEPELISWKVSKAWGYKLPEDEAGRR